MRKDSEVFRDEEPQTDQCQDAEMQATPYGVCLRSLVEEPPSRADLSGTPRILGDDSCMYGESLWRADRCHLEIAWVTSTRTRPFEGPQEDRPRCALRLIPARRTPGSRSASRSSWASRSWRSDLSISGTVVAFAGVWAMSTSRSQVVEERDASCSRGIATRTSSVSTPSRAFSCTWIQSTTA